MKTALSIICQVCLWVSFAGAENLLPNGSFDQGLKGWQTGDASSEEILVVSPGECSERQAVQIDARRISWGERSVLSQSFPVNPSSSYEVRGRVKRLAGYGYRASVAVVWKNANGQVLGVDNVWQSVLLGTNWVQESRRVISPDAAVAAQIKVGIEMGTGERNAALFTGLEFVSASPSGANLAIQLFEQKITKGSSGALTVHLTNTGDECLSDLKISLELPAGMTAESNVWVCGRLGAAEVWEQTVSTAGMPGTDTSVCLTVTAKAHGKPVQFSQNTPVNLSDAKPEEVSSENLQPSSLPDMKVKLGAYYFPVMIDWGGAGGRPGLRAIDQEPLLGYYNERSPEVADWHITWARQHGVSWFAVDWYWNQGEEFLNEALDEGLLNSRFADQMQFCIHWCNQDPACTTFRAYDYSPATLREMTVTLCDRYFSRKNYLTVDGEPVFMVFQPASLMNDNGGAAGAKAALGAMEEVARSRGLKGIYFIAVNNSPVVPDYASAGFDAVAPYSFLYANLLPERTDRIKFDYAQLVQRYVDYFKFNQEQVHSQGLDYIPTAWAGWDDLSRYGKHRFEQSVVTAGNTPAAFRAMAQALPEYAEKENPLALVEAWNEWGEGTVIEPGRGFGFDYLSALINVLAVNPPAAYPVPVPNQTSWQRMQAAPVFIDNVRYAERFNAGRQWSGGLAMEFESKRSLWLRAAKEEDYVWIEGGMLHALLNSAKAHLAGPEAVWLDTQKVKGFELRLKTAAATGLTLQWKTAQNAEWNAGPVQPVPDGEWSTVRFECSGHPGWSGEVYQFRFVFQENPGSVEMDWVKTF